MNTLQKIIALVFVCCFLLTSVYAAEGENTMDAVTEIVQTAKGAVEGYSVTGRNGTTVHCYNGIPYAEAPVGDLRWKNAVEKEPWDGVLDCTADVTELNSNYQWGNMLLDYFLTLNQSEDCLLVNVRTPAETTDDKLPVMVWFHGGGLFGGSGSEEVYNRTDLPEEGVVLVTVTMRLGGFGILPADVLGSEKGSEESGNYIISDMLMALNWVQENIEAFGGDPANVTIDGESGGASKVTALLCAPQAEGLFTKAILQSGFASSMSYEDALAAGNSLMEALGVTTAEEARAVPAEEVLAAYNELGLDMGFIVDDYYLSGDPLALIEAGEYTACPVLLGVNEGEIPNIGAGDLPGYPTLLNASTAAGFDCYAYEFDQVPGEWKDLGFHAVHSLDLAYMFGERVNEDRFYNGGPWEQQFFFWGAGETLDQFEDFTEPAMDEVDIALSDMMIAMWANFIRSGDPSTEDFQWTPWTAENEDYIHLTAMNGNTTQMKTGYTQLWSAEE